MAAADLRAFAAPDEQGRQQTVQTAGGHIHSELPDRRSSAGGSAGYHNPLWIWIQQ